MRALPAVLHISKTEVLRKGCGEGTFQKSPPRKFFLPSPVHTAGTAVPAGGAACTAAAFFLCTDQVVYRVAQRAENGGGYQNGAHKHTPFRNQARVPADARERLVFGSYVLNSCHVISESRTSAAACPTLKAAPRKIKLPSCVTRKAMA